MGKRRKAPNSDGAAEAAAPFNNPFAGLGQLVPETAPGAGGPDASAPDNPEPEPAPVDSAEWSVGGKVVLRRERKGHGGKTVTVVSGLVLRGIEPAMFARTLGKQLGCAARLAGEQVVLAGDQRDRAAELLRNRGARQIVTA